MPKKIPRTPLNFCSGVTCGFNFRASYHTPLTFEVNISLRVDLVYIYNLVMNFVFNGGVEEFSMVCRQLESIALLLLEVTMVIMFFLVVIKSLLKILFRREEM